MLKKLPQKINDFKVLKDLGRYKEKPNIREDRYAIFICKYCSSDFTSRVRHIKDGNKKSCGCKTKELRSRKTHGHSGEYLYSIWNAIKQRCYNKKSNGYGRYGAKGTTMCDEWKNDYLSFKKWCIDNGYTKGMSIDKDILHDSSRYKIYSPSTCSVVTPLENSQTKNKSLETDYVYLKNGLYVGDKRAYGVRYLTRGYKTRLEARAELEVIVPVGNL